MTYDGSIDTNNGLDRVSLYVDGVAETTSLEIQSQELLGIADSTAPVNFGAGDVGSNYFFDGTLDEVRVYNRALSPTEINHNAIGSPQ